MIIFEVWEDEDEITLSTPENIKLHKEKGLLSSNSKFLYQIEAKNYEEAMSFHYQKIGLDLYKPIKG